MAPAVDRPATSRFRWVICGLLFLATVIAYVDRGILGYLEVTWQGRSAGTTSPTDMWRPRSKWPTPSALWRPDGSPTAWALAKRFAIAIVLWSFAAMSPGLATSALTFGIAMFFLGLGEAANFPACIKTVAEWFPRSERALATSLFNSGANIGAMLVPVVVPVLVVAFTWRGRVRGRRG